MFAPYIADSSIFLAIFAALGGCAIRYAEIYKNTNRIKFSYFVIDLLIAAFLGFLTFWVLMEHKLCKESYAMLVNCIIGNMGSKVLELGSYWIYSKFGINYKFEDRYRSNDSKRNPK